jgi:hypothetical protein
MADIHWQRKDVIDAPVYDIFENSSPQRPLGNNRGTLGNESVDYVATSPPVNFSRKRAHQRTESTTSMLSPSGHDSNNVNTGPKRQKADHWRPDDGAENLPPTATDSSPTRPSKFLEASMHDRPSEKPPSVFMRAFNKHLHENKERNMDSLMEEYDEANKQPSPNKSDSKRQTQMKGLTHHPNMSISSHNTGASANTNESKQSSIFRFGRNVISSFNPINIFRGATTTWDKTKEELIEEKRAENEELRKKQELKERAEQTYAQLKRAGQLGKQGTTHFHSETVFTPGYVEATDDEPNSRDSGIHMDDDSRRSSTDQDVKWAPIEFAEKQPKRKSSFHLRSPSFSNLKKFASSTSLHLHRGASSTSLSPEKQDDGSHGLVRSASKQDLVKQAKLQRRVSDLEAKLEAARRELHLALEDAPPVPPIPPQHAEVAPRATTKRNSLHRAFAPMPSLPSERLLNAMLKPEADAREDEVKVRDFAVEPVQNAEVQGSDVMQSVEYEVADNNVTPKPTKKAKPPAKKTTQQTSSLRAVSPPPQGDDDEISKKSTPNKNNKKRKSGGKDVDLAYRPSSDDNDDMEWAEATSAKKLKKNKKSDVSDSTNGPNNSPNDAEKNKANDKKLPAAPSARSSSKPAVLKKANPVIPKKLPSLPSEPDPVLPAPIQEAPAVIVTEPQPPTSLDTVVEETASVVSVKLNSSPAVPTAIKTPAHPSGLPRGPRPNLRNRSLSPSKPSSGSPQRGHDNNANDYVSSYVRHRDGRGAIEELERGRSSAATPRDNGMMGNMSPERKSRSPRVNKGKIVKVRPGEKNVPPMPSGPVTKEEWEWPDDVF